MAELGHLSGRADLSFSTPGRSVTWRRSSFHPRPSEPLLVAEAELGERILRALILRRVALIEIGFGGPVSSERSPRGTWPGCRISSTQRNSFPGDRSRSAPGRLVTTRAIRPAAGRAPGRGPAGRHGAEEPDEAGVVASPGPGGDELPLRTVRRGHRRRGSGRARDRGLCRFRGPVHRRARSARLRRTGRPRARASRTISAFRPAFRGRL